MILKGKYKIIIFLTFLSNFCFSQAVKLHVYLSYETSCSNNPCISPDGINFYLGTELALNINASTVYSLYGVGSSVLTKDYNTSNDIPTTMKVEYGQYSTTLYLRDVGINNLTPINISSSGNVQQVKFNVILEPIKNTTITSFVDKLPPIYCGGERLIIFMQDDYYRNFNIDYLVRETDIYSGSLREWTVPSSSVKITTAPIPPVGSQVVQTRYIWDILQNGDFDYNTTAWATPGNYIYPGIGTYSGIATTYHPRPTAQFKQINSPTCKGGDNSSFVISVSGYLGRGVDQYIINLKKKNSNNQYRNWPYGSQPSDTIKPYFYNTLSVTGFLITLNSDNFFQKLPAGDYKMELKNFYNSYGSQCPSYYDFTIPEGPEPRFSANRVPIAGSSYFTTCPYTSDGRMVLSATGGNGGPFQFSVSGFNNWFNADNSNRTTVTGLSGSYTIRVRDGRLCVSTVTSTVNITPPLSFNVSASFPQRLSRRNVDISCKGGNDGFVALNLSGGTGILLSTVTGTTSNYFSTNGGSSVYYENLMAEDHNVYIRDAFGCSGYFPNAFKTIEPLEPLTISSIDLSWYNNYNVKCYGDNNANITIIGKGGVFGVANPFFGNYNDFYQIPDIGQAYNNPVFNSLRAGVYTAELTDGNGCFTQRTFEIKQPDPLLVNGKNRVTYNGYAVSCNRLNEADDFTLFSNGIITLTGNGGVIEKPYSFFLNGSTVPGFLIDDSSSLYENLSMGGYSFQIVDDNNCSISDTFYLTQPPALQVLKPVTIMPNCYYYADGMASISVTGGIPFNITYNLKLVDSAYQEHYYDSVIYARTSFFTSMPKGKYEISARDSNQCMQRRTFNLNEPLPLSMPTGDIQGYTACIGSPTGSIATPASGGTPPYKFTWTQRDLLTPIGTDSIFIGAPGQYDVYLSDSHNCKNSGYGNPNATPIGEKRPAFIRGPYDTLKLNLINIIPPTCFKNADGAIEVEGSGGYNQGFLYSLDINNFTTPGGKFQGLTSGVYKFYVNDNTHGSCIDSLIVNLPQPDSLILNHRKENIRCFEDGSGKLIYSSQGGTAPYTYSVSGISTGFTALNTLTGVLPGIYSIASKDNNGCLSLMVKDTITQPTQLIVEESTFQSICGSASGYAFVNISGGVPPYTINWSNGRNDNTITGLSAGLFTVTVTDNNLCTNIQSRILDDQNGPKVEAKLVKAATCAESKDGEAILNLIKESVGGYTFQWVNIKDTVGNKAYGLRGGTYQGGIKDKDGCIGADTVFIPSPAPILITFTGITPPTCYGYKDGSITIKVGGGNSGYSFQWNDSLAHKTQNIAGLGANKSQMAIDGKDLRFTEYKITVTDNKNCTGRDSLKLMEPGKVEVNLPYDSLTLCEGQYVSLDAGNPANTTKWYKNDAEYSNTQKVTLSSSGNYRVVSTDSKGCSGSKQFQLYTSKNLLESNFIVNSDATVGDTTLLAEISWPVPDSIQWTIPKNVRIVNKYKDRLYVVIDTVGSFEIGLDAYMSTCKDKITKKIAVEAKVDSSLRKGVSGYSGITVYNLFPNPSNGHFTITYALTDPMPVNIVVLQGITMQNIFETQREGQLFNNETLDFSLLPAGVYLMQLKTARSIKNIKFVIIH